MTIYTCSRCAKVFNQKIDFDRHVNRKFPCAKVTNNTCQLNNTNKLDLRAFIKEELTEALIAELKAELLGGDPIKSLNLSKKKQHICKYCSQHYTTNSNLCRHMRSCSEKGHAVETKNNPIEPKQQSVTNITNNIDNTTNNTNTTNNNNNVINYIDNRVEIKMVAYGSEDLSYLTDSTYKRLINKGFQSVQALVEEVHFNKNKPEHSNIYSSNSRVGGFVHVYDGTDWKIDNKKNVIAQMYKDKKDALIEKYEELGKKKLLPEYTVNKFSRFLNDERDEAVSKPIMDDLELILYNNRGIPKSVNNPKAIK